MLDALWGAYVDKALPPDAWVPGTKVAVRGKAA
jgi:hypothetical protein